MDRHSDEFAIRPRTAAPRVYLINAVASASSYTKDGRFLLNISWTRQPGDWFAAWTTHGTERSLYRRVPRLDAADREHLGQLVGEVITPDCLNYGENGVLDPEENPHKCDPATDLGYEGEIGAPGYGQAWSCKVCDAPWVKVGDTFSQNDPDGGEPFNILTINDVR